MYDLAIIIPARQEEFLSRTVDDIFEHRRGKTEVIVVLDGAWSDPPLKDYPDLTILYLNQSIGQRAATNQGVRLSKAKWIMKVDAHCSFDEGFDVKIFEGITEDMTVIPTLYNLHVLDLVCINCGDRHYQGPIEDFKTCDNCGGKRERQIVWKPRFNRQSLFYRFDTDMHFQYHNARKKSPENVGDIVETMSAQGSCFMLTRDKYWELNLGDEAHGSWGGQGSQVACATWLSGVRLVTNKKTWYAHCFRTQGKSWGFPYPQDGKAVEKARQYSKDLWLNNKHPKQTKSLAWLIKRFAPLNNGEKDGVADWHDPKGKAVLDYVNQKGREFVENKKNNKN